MKIVDLNEFNTLIIGLLALIAGELFCRNINALKKLAIPSAVVGGLMVALLNYSLEHLFSIKLVFGAQLRDILILVFFATLGFTARISALRSGGKPFIYLCIITVLLLVMQNIIGIATALITGAHPFYGLLAGSVSFVGGPGTALAWSKEASAMGLEYAELIALSAATFAVASGAIVAGPVVAWIIKRHKLSATDKNAHSSVDVAAFTQPSVSFNSYKVSIAVAIIFLSVLMGMQLHEFAKAREVRIPAFLCALITAILITNISDRVSIALPSELINNTGEMALNVFLVISMMSLKISAIGVVIVPLLSIVAIEILISVAIAYFILFRVLGKNYDAAVTVGGFLGYGISSMPVAMACMEQITRRHGPSPRAILVITLAGAFFVDIANAFIVKGFVSVIDYLPMP